MKKLHPKYLKLFVVSLSLLLITACATPYQGIKEPAPKGWTGANGFNNLIDTAQSFEGKRTEGDPIVEFETAHRRTALVAQTVKLKTAFGGDLIIKQGYPAYAVDFSVRKTIGSSSYGTDMQAGYNPIEWCIILKDGANGKGDKPDLYCLLWESSKSARYIKSSSNYMYNPTLIGEANGMSGAVPTFIEQDVDFGVTLKRRISIRSINKQRISLVVTETDGVNTKNSSGSSRINLNFDENDEVHLTNVFGRFLIKRTGDKTVTVTDLTK